MMDEASPPNFTYERPAPDQLIMHYHSKRQLCHLMEGLLEGVAEHFQVPIEYKQTSCTHRGDQNCVFWLQFAKAPRVRLPRVRMSGNDGSSSSSRTRLVSCIWPTSSYSRATLTLRSG